MWQCFGGFCISPDIMVLMAVVVVGMAVGSEDRERESIGHTLEVELTVLSAGGGDVWFMLSPEGDEMISGASSRTLNEDTLGNINYGPRLRPVMIDSGSGDGWRQRP